MGSTSWRDDILQALVIGLIVQIVVSILRVFWAALWASLQERVAPGSGFRGESMAESDLEMGSVNAGAGATIPGTDNSNGLAVNSGVGDDDELEHTEDMADTRASTPEARIPISVVVDASHNQQVEVVAGKED